MPTAKSAKVSNTKTSAKKSSVSKKAPDKQVVQKSDYDNPRNLVIGGIIGLILSYVIISRALNTGSYWEYFFGVVFLILAIRLFIRAIRLK